MSPEKERRPGERIRVVIVDDSAFVRKALVRILNTDPVMEVAGIASSGMEAVEMIAEVEPDVVTLDVVMPGMDGIETLRAIMERRPTPVLMLSQLTKEGAELTLQALELGAMDFVDKSATGMMDFFDHAKEILSKVRSIAGSRPLRMGTGGHADFPKGRGLIDVVAVGASTGGPPALQLLLTKFPKDISFSILIVQHMPHGFTGPLAKRLDVACDIHVKEAEEGDPVNQPGIALIAPAGLHMKIHRTSRSSRIKLDLEPLQATHRPSVDVLFASVAKNYGPRGMGVLLTGMGSDGARGMKAIKEEGGPTLAQDKSSSAIYGMPRVALETGAADRAVPITSMADEIMKKGLKQKSKVRMQKQ